MSDTTAFLLLTTGATFALFLLQDMLSLRVNVSVLLICVQAIIPIATADKRALFMGFILNCGLKLTYIFVLAVGFLTLQTFFTKICYLEKLKYFQ